MADSGKSSLLVGRFELLQPLGRGGMGVIYRVLDHLTGQHVALKRVILDAEPAALKTSPFVTHFDYDQLNIALAQEFYTLASLYHPNIVGVLDYGFDAERQPFYTMPLIENGQDFLDAAWKTDTVGKVRLLNQVLAALVYIHRHGILHRDIKPSNLRLDDAGQVKLMDFGLSAVSANSRRIVGTLAYLPPEIASGSPASFAADLYSFGVVAYMTFAGVHPFSGAAGDDLMRRLLHDTPDLERMDAPSAVRLVVGRLLLKNPEARYPDAGSVSRALSEAVGLPVSDRADAAGHIWKAARFVGREAELARLRTILDNIGDAVRGGAGGVLMIGGESGIGKTRLLEELRTHALVEGFRALWGRGVEGGGLPYQMLRDLLPGAIIDLDLSDLEAGVLQQVIPNIEQIIGRSVPPLPELTGSAREDRLSGIIRSVFVRQHQPTILLLDDLQWAGDSLPILVRLTALAENHPLLIVGAFRDDAEFSPTDHFPNAEVMAVKRLRRPDIRQIAESMLGAENVTPPLVDLLERETGGNIFLIVDMLQALSRSGDRLDQMTVEPAPQIDLSAGALGITSRYLARVPAADHPLLMQAAVIGRQIDPALLRWISPETDLEAWALRCHHGGALEYCDGQWCFTHDRLREGLLFTLDTALTVTLNHRAAEAIESVYQNTGDYALRLLHHWRAAENADRERVYLELLAYRYVEWKGYFREAIPLLERALALTPDESPLYLTFLNLLGRAWMRLGDYDKALIFSELALEPARRRGDTAIAAYSIETIGQVAMNQGDYDLALRHALDSVAIARQLDDPKLLANSLSALSSCAADAGDHDLERQSLDEAWVLIKTLDAPQIRAGLLNNYGIAASRDDDFDQAMDYFQQYLALSQSIGDRFSVGVAHANIAGIYEHQYEYQQAVESLLRAHAIYREVGHRLAIVNSAIDLSYSLMALHDERAIQYLYEGLVLATELKVKPNQALSVLAFACWFEMRGIPVRAAELVGLALTFPKYVVFVTFRIEALLAKLLTTLGTEALDAAVAGGQQLDLDETVSTLLKGE